MQTVLTGIAMVVLTAAPLPAHNVDQRMAWLFFDTPTLEMIQARVTANDFPLLRAGDQVRMVLKTAPEPSGATTGVGGYMSFYVPEGTRVLDAEYVFPDGSGGFVKIPSKGQAIMPLGDGPVGARDTPDLVGLVLGPNVVGTTSPPVNAAGEHLGTLAGVYGDTGIFYSTDPETAWSSWSGGPMTNNRGEVVTPTTEWDAEQLRAYGRKDVAPIIDPDGRGSSPWGLASGVAGPESGYAWQFDADLWDGTPQTPADLQAAASTVGPWKRIRYFGDQVGDDIPGNTDSTLGYAGIDAGALGVVVSPASPLDPTLDLGDLTSPKAVRVSVGELIAGRFEYARITLEILADVGQPNSPFDANGCFEANGDVFGGDAGGEQGGKDHLWRYYDPTTATVNPCALLVKKASKSVVQNGEIFQYTIELWNTSATPLGSPFVLTDIVITDTLPGEVEFISAVPAQEQGPNPLVWRVPSLAPGEMWEATLTVRARSSGRLAVNQVEVTTAEGISAHANEVVWLGASPVLIPQKSVSPDRVSPGDTVQYTLTVLNQGGGPSGNPVVIEDYLSPGFTFESLDSVRVNRANAINQTTVDASDPSRPIFTVARAIEAERQLELVFTARVGGEVLPGVYTNAYSVTYRDPVLGKDAVIATGAVAPVTVGGAAVGDTVFLDWNGNGVQDPGEGGIGGVVIELQDGVCTPGTDCPLQVTGASGAYLFNGLGAGTYTVAVIGGIPAGYAQTGDPDEPGAACTTCDGESTVTLADDEELLDRDFGYLPGGVGAIGDLVFEDVGNDGGYDAGTDPGIDAITVDLYVDTNGDGTLDGGDLLIATTATAGGGIYGFAGLAPGIDYLVDVDESDPDLAAYFSPDTFVATTADPHAVAALAGAYADADFGFFAEVPGSIGDQLFLDADGDGVFDAGEAALPFVDVRLWRDTDGDGVGDVLAATVTSGADGTYTFAGLGPGSYVVDVAEADPDVPTGWAPARDDIAVNLGVGEDRTDVDFPFVRYLEKTADKGQVNAGETITYTLRPGYPGSELLSNVLVTDPTPAGSTYNGNASPTPLSEPAIGGTGDVVWNLGSNVAGSPGITPGTALCPASLTLESDADTFIREDNPDVNWGTRNRLETRPFDNRRHGFVHFDLSGLPAGAVIDRADFLFTSRDARNNHLVEVREALTAWTEGTQDGGACVTGATWNAPNCTDAWAGGGAFSSADYGATVYGTFTPVGGDTQLSVDLAPLVQDWADGAAANRGVVLLATGTDNGQAQWYPREEGPVERRPQLAIQYRIETPGGCTGVDTLAAEADTYVREDKADNNYGVRNPLETNPDNDGAGTSERHGLQRFDLSPVPPGATINSAVLKVISRNSRNNHVVQVRQALTAWTEGTGSDNACVTGASWNAPNCTDAWAGGGAFSSADYGATVYGTFTPVGGDAQLSVDVTALVDDWVNNGVANDGFVLLATGTDTGQAQWGIREDAGREPVLEVDWTLGASAARSNTLTAAGTLATDGRTVTVTMELDSESAVADIAPGALTVNGAGGAGASCGAAALTSADDDLDGTASDRVAWEWTCTVSAGAAPGSVTFEADAAGDGGASSFELATSNSVIVTPPLTFQVTATGAVDPVANTASLSSSADEVDLCYTISDEQGATDDDTLFRWDAGTGASVLVGAIGSTHVEAATWDPTATLLYVTDRDGGVGSGSDLFGTLDPATAAFIPIGRVASAASPLEGPLGSFTVADIDGMSFHPGTGVLYAVHRREGATTQLDLLLQIDPTTGLHVEDAFGAGTDYLVLDTSGLPAALYDVDDLAFDPVSHTLYGIANTSLAGSGLNDRLVTIDPATAAVTDVAAITNSAGGGSVEDVEGLSFSDDGTLYGTTGSGTGTSTDDNLWTLDLATAVATLVTALPNGTFGDYESLACLPATTALIPPTASNTVYTAILASIGDTVWADLDGDGTQDPGEAGIGGVTLELRDGVCTPGSDCPTLLTAADGSYRFWSLGPGSYTVVMDLDTVPPDYRPTTVVSFDIVLAGGEQHLDADFGLRPPGAGSIGDTVWVDRDEDGVLDVGEPPLAGITVRLYEDVDNDGIINLGAGDLFLGSETTDANGNYLFGGVHDGDYLLQVDAGSLPAGLELVFDPDEAAPCTTCDGIGDAAVTGGASELDVDFGYNWTGAIGDYVWYDDDGDRVQDPGEEGIPGVVVLLVEDTNGNGRKDMGEPEIDVAFTDAAGLYLFTDVAPGDYVVDVYEVTVLSRSGEADKMVATTGDKHGLTLAPGATYLDADFGWIEGATIGDVVFHDVDHNGIQDLGEPGLPAVTVTLTGTDVGGNPVSRVADTDAFGVYTFAVPPGTYTVTYDPADLPADLTEPTTPVSHLVTVVAGQELLEADFGFDHPGAVGDRVFVDADGSGTADAGEPGLPGITVRLWEDENGNGELDPEDDLLAIQATDAAGGYLFEGLEDGAYLVEVDPSTLPAGYLPTADPDEPGAPCTGCDNLGSATVAGGGADLDADFGYQPPVVVHSVSGRIWDDDGSGGGIAGDGAQNGTEPGLAGVTVDVAVDLDGDGTPDELYTTVTDASGDWSVAGIADGADVAVTVDESTLPSPAYVQSGDPDEPGACSICDGATAISGITADVGGLDFGYLAQLGSLAGTVCEGGGNGLCDPAETVLAGVTVILTYAGDDGILGTADDVIAASLTDGSGDYLFSGLEPGIYQVSEVNPPTWESVADADGGNPDSISLLLAVGESRADQDFEDRALELAAVGDRVWLDLDRDGVQDVGEPGLANVTLDLYEDPDGVQGSGDEVLVSSSRTDADGIYLFAGLAAGSYFVDLTDLGPDGLPGTGDEILAGLTTAPGTSDPDATVDLGRTDRYLDADFGYTPADPTTAAIGDFVWSDADGDGIQDPGEAGLGGVRMALVSDPGPDGLYGTADDAVEALTTTHADGSYLFTGVAPGEYVVVADVGPDGIPASGDEALGTYTPTSGPQSEGSRVSDPVSAAAGDAVTDVDFGFTDAALFTISDRVWRDDDGDGALDLGEEGIAGVTVNLLDATGSVVATVTSDPVGGFSFVGLPDGDYQLEITDHAGELDGLSGTSPSAESRLLAVTVAGSDVSGVHFGYNTPGVVGDTVFSDGDGDGVQDPGEPGIGGVTVELWRDADADGIFDPMADTFIGITLTDATGRYLFSGLGGGTYFASVDDAQAALAGYAPTTTDEQPSAAGTQIDAVLVGPGAGFLDADFGYRQSALPDLSGNVFSDLDRDGVDDGAGEPGIAGVTIALLDGAGNVVATTVSDPAGDYAFVDLAPGDYVVTVTDEDGILDAYALTSGLDAIEVTVAASDITGVDFGYARDSGSASVGDTVWLDVDRNGAEGSGEPGITGVAVELWDVGPDGAIGTGDDLFVARALTDAAGQYRFADLVAGGYYVAVDGATLPAGLELTGGSDPSVLISLSEGEFYEQADFGYGTALGRAVIGDTVFYDADGDGLQDPGEIGLAGVAVELRDGVCTPGADCQTMVTSSSGRYLFTDLAPGTYTVSVDVSTLPAGFNPVPTNGPADRPVAVGASQALLTVDYGFDAPAGVTGSIGDTVFRDEDGDGVRDPGEPGIEGVTLNLVDSAGNVLATTFTDAGGAYDFVGLPAGDYRVEVTDINGILDGLNLSAGTNPTALISLAAGQDYDAADFGYSPSGGAGSIGDTVWHDVDGDGVYEPLGADGVAGTADDEPGFEGVGLDLWLDVDLDGVITPGIDNLIRRAATDANGVYLFTGVPAGEYLVDLTDVRGVLDVDRDGQIDGDEWVRTAGSDPAAVTLTAAAPNEFGADFGYRAAEPYAISGTAFHDFNGDGMLNFADTGEEGVTVYLFRDLDSDGVLDSDDALVGTLITDASGEYLFADLPPADYLLAVDPSGSDVDGGTQTTQLATGGVQPVSLVDGDSVDNDFGFRFGPTLAQISRFDAWVSAGRLVLEWESSSEVGTVGFYVYRWDERDELWRPVAERLVAGAGASQGGVYRLVDEEVGPAREGSYALVEVDSFGGETLHGPFRVAADWTRRESDGELESWGDSSRPRRAPAGALERLARARPARIERGPDPDLGGRHGSALKLLVEAEGLYFAGAGELAASWGVPQERVRALLLAGRLALECQGSRVSWLPAADGAGLFFYGQAAEGIYARHNVYWLAPGRGAVMEELEGGSPRPVGGERWFVSTIDFEEELTAASVVAQSPEEDYWFWQGLIAGDPRHGTKSFPLEVPDPAATAGPASLEVRLHGASDTPAARDHHAVVRWNGVEVGEIRWDGIGGYSAELEVPAALLAAGVNEVEVEGLLEGQAPYSHFFVDGFALSYGRRFRASGDRLEFRPGVRGVVTVAGFSSPDILVFEIGDRRHPRLVAGTTIDVDEGYRVSFAVKDPEDTFLALTPTVLEEPGLVRDRVSDLVSGRSDAEYLVIAGPGLVEAAQELAERRRRQGLRTAVVSVEDVWDELRYGLVDPGAIREFLARLWERGGGRLRWAVLLGAGTLDYKDHLGFGGNLVPPLMAVSPFGLFASDVSLGDVEGGDGVPEVAVGRIPVLTAGELESYLAKLDAFEGAAGQPWRRRALMLADDPDAGGSFPLASEAVAALLPEDWARERIYLSEMPVAEARQALLAGLDEGAALVNYLGHGGMDRLAAEGLLTSADVGALGNADRPVVMSALTCVAGRFEAPGFESLAEELVLAPDGAVAMWAPSGLSYNDQAQILNEGFVAAAFGGGAATLGEAIRAAHADYAERGGYPFMLRIYNLIGDPALAAE